ncbi:MULTISPECIES: hypothetical protein [Rhodococcus]|uniref:hypothetical protein n=1 Tax=Rhodococcus TaxID=1827 RepID=UPI0013CC5EE2|nr:MULTISPECIES: hypothetical protein [Rhodococcus]KAF0964925.1 hypothetical protein MLGJGCBP_01919 [Rhodococcus sp. T7]UOT08307.1 hypothetical protein MPY17_39045 [Rhodococcus opacus]
MAELETRPVGFAKGDLVAWTVRRGLYTVVKCSRASVVLLPVVPEPYATPEGGWITHPSKLRPVDFVEVGRAAHAEGETLSHALSAGVRRALEGLAVGDGLGRKIMSDFVEGWTAASLAFDLCELAESASDPAAIAAELNAAPRA